MATKLEQGRRDTLNGRVNADEVASLGLPAPQNGDNYYTYISRLSPEQQQKLFAQTPAAADVERTFRGMQVQRGEIDPNDPRFWQGDRTQRATGLLAGNAKQSQDYTDEVRQQMAALGLGDYTYDPTLINGLPESMRGAGPADSLEALIQDRAFNMSRSDTTGVDAQKRVLGAVEAAIGQGGLDQIDRARLAEISAAEARQRRGALGALRARAEQTGRANGVGSQVSQQMAIQDSINNQAMRDMQVGALGLDRKNQLMGLAGNLGGNVQSASDVIDQFNTIGERQRIQNNLAAQNAARTAVWGENSTRQRDLTAAQNNATVGQAEYNANAQNGADRFNVSPGQGARGLTSETQDAISSAIAGQQNANINLSNQQQGLQDRVAQTTANKTQAAIGAVGAGLDFAGNIIGKTVKP